MDNSNDPPAALISAMLFRCIICSCLTIIIIYFSYASLVILMVACFNINMVFINFVYTLQNVFWLYVLHVKDTRVSWVYTLLSTLFSCTLALMKKQTIHHVPMTLNLDTALQLITLGVCVHYQPVILVEILVT